MQAVKNKVSKVSKLMITGTRGDKHPSRFYEEELIEIINQEYASAYIDNP